MCFISNSFVFHQNLMILGEVFSTHKVLQHQQVLPNSDEKQKVLILTHLTGR